tara:strand:- start:2959 stop:3891 length:933 start_codon:yes stop_codon:yes gene_type:complete
MKKQQLIITKGLPASGKSTWARQKVKESNGTLKRINKDDIRAMVEDSKWSPEREKYTVAARDAMVRAALYMGKSVVVDDTNLVQKHEDALRKIAQEFNIADVEVIVEDSFLSVPFETCLERNRKRTGKARVPHNSMLRMAEQIGIDVSNYEGEVDTKNAKVDARRKTVEYNKDLPDAIISDLDGTLSLMWGNRTAYEATKCDTDLVNEPVASIVRDYADMGVRIILFSGRTDDGIEQTKSWLAEHNIPYDELHMRKYGDFQKDGTLKEDFYNTFVKDKYNVRFVLDDRDQVVEKWRELGLLCNQVFYGNF